MSAEKISSKPLELNLTQWRRDIQTFAIATAEELLSITDQLSAKLADRNTVGQQESGIPDVNDDRETNSKSDNRLFRLKEQLERKLKS